METENIGALVHIPHQKKIEQFPLNCMELFETLDSYWMKKEGLVFYPFDRTKQAYFYGNTVNQKPVNEYDLMVNEALTKEEYETSVFMAKQAISSGQIKKVVLARNEIISGEHDPFDVFKNAVKKYTSSYGYYVNIGPEQWVGASPELLIHYEDGILSTIALAGTKSLDEKFTPKEENEQLLVCDFIEEKLDLLGLTDFQKSATTEENFNTIKHLKTAYEVPCSKQEALELLKSLQPTSAVCGLPRDRRFEFIQDFETMNRSFYSGMTGILKKDSATFFVNLRCMRFYQNTIELFAGAGITEDSDPTAEWEETEKKIAAIKQLLEN